MSGFARRCMLLHQQQQLLRMILGAAAVFADAGRQIGHSAARYILFLDIRGNKTSQTWSLRRARGRWFADEVLDSLVAHKIYLPSPVLINKPRIHDTKSLTPSQIIQNSVFQRRPLRVIYISSTIGFLLLLVQTVLVSQSRHRPLTLSAVDSDDGVGPGRGRAPVGSRRQGRVRHGRIIGFF